MSTRIRYRTTEDINVLESSKEFEHPSNGGLFRVRLNLTTLTFEIIDERANLTVKTGEATTVQLLKMAAKQALDDLDIKFESETRQRYTSTKSAGTSATL